MEKLKKNILRVVFICKKKLIQWIEKIPTGEKRSIYEDQNIPFSALLKISGHLLRNLHINEKSFRATIGCRCKDPKAYYLYGVVSEVISSCMSCMRVASWIDESEEEFVFGYPKRDEGDDTISGNRIGHLMHESIVDEFNVRFRKLQEHFFNLICFSETNDQKYFQLFFIAQELSDVNYTNKDIEVFFGRPVENFKHESKELLDQCKKLIRDLEKEKCWFLDQRLNFDSKTQGKIMSSYSHRYKKALQIASEGEKILLGPTYKTSYGRSSESAHSTIKEWDEDYTFNDARFMINKTFMICFNILSRISELTGSSLPQKFKDLLKHVRSAGDTENELKSVTRRNLENGDLVTTDGLDVAEILNMEQSSYGYEDYHVRYLINPKIKEITDEWIPAPHIGPLLFRKSKAREFYKKNVAPLLGDKSIDWIDQQTNEALYDRGKAAILQLAKSGYLKRIFEISKVKNKENNKV